MKSQQPNVIKGKDRQQITDVTWGIKGDIFRIREMRVGLRGLARLKRKARTLKKKCLRRYIDNEKV